MPQFEPRQRNGDLRLRSDIKAGEPLFERAAAVCGEVMAQLWDGLR
jgi:hypothetical protein